MPRVKIIVVPRGRGLGLGLGHLKSGRTQRGSGGIERTLDIPCALAAITAREDALIAAQKAAADKLLAAYQARKTALLAAYALTDQPQRHQAVTAAWRAFSTSARLARMDWLEARTDIWVTYGGAGRACGGPVPVELGTDEVGNGL